MSNSEDQQDQTTRPNLRERASQAADRARAKASDAAEKARAKARDAAERARARGRTARRSATESVEQNPLIAIAGGLAIGAILAGILPRTATEDRAVGRIGTRIRSTAREAVRSAKENARSQLDELGLNSDSAKEKLGGIAGKLAKAATAAGSAAAESAIRKK